MAQCLKLKEVKSEPSEFANEFCELYCSVMQNVYDLKCQNFLNEVKWKLRNMRRMKYFMAIREETSFFGNVNFEKIAARCAYMYSYSVLITSAVYRQFSKHLEGNENEQMLLQHFSSKTLKLCCLGGGGGIEAVGLIKAIHDIIWKSHCKDAVEVHVTVVDICSEWKSELSAIVNELNKNSYCFNVRKMNYRAEVFEADLLQPLEETLQDIIKGANVISIVNFINAAQEKKKMDCLPRLRVMMKTVIECMSEESCLFMLDTAGGSLFYRIANVTSEYPSCFTRQMNSHNGYRLHPKTLKKLEGVLNFRGFANSDTLFPTRLTKVSSCIWIKKSFCVEGDEIEEESLEETKTEKAFKKKI